MLLHAGLEAEATVGAHVEAVADELEGLEDEGARPVQGPQEGVFPGHH